MGEAAPQLCRPREPKNSQYYQCVEDHFETFEQVYDERFSRQYGFFRPYTKEVIYRYLDCGDLHHGFARVKCPDCGVGNGRSRLIFPFLFKYASIS